MDTLAALQSLLDVVEQGGFTKAARRQGVAPSSLTRQLDALEQRVGVRLLNRSPRVLHLTAAGERYLAQVREPLAALQAAEAALRPTARGELLNASLRVTLPVLLAERCLAPQLPALLERHPGLRLSLQLSDEPVDLVAEGMDLALRIGAPTRQPGLVSRRLAGHPRVLVASPAYLARAGQPATPQQLAAHRALVFDYAGEGPPRWRLWPPSGGAGVLVKPAGALSANHAGLLLQLCLAGQGLALLPLWLVQPELQSGRLQRLLPSWRAQPLRDGVCLHALYLPGQRSNRGLQALLAWLQPLLADWP